MTLNEHRLGKLRMGYTRVQILEECPPPIFQGIRHPPSAWKENPGERTEPLLGEQVSLVPWVFAEGGFYCISPPNLNMTDSHKIPHRFHDGCLQGWVQWCMLTLWCWFRVTASVYKLRGFHLTQIHLGSTFQISG